MIATAVRGDLTPTTLSTRPVLLTPLGIEAAAARLGARGADVERIGMGPAKAAASDLRLSAAVADDRACAVVGFAAGLSRSDRAGDVVVASELVTLDEPSRLRALDERLCRRIVAALSGLGSVRRGRVVSSRRVVRADELADLGTSTGSLACDMESAFLPELSSRASFAVVRVLLDRPGHPLLRPSTLARGCVAVARLVAVSRVISAVLAEPEPQP